jgi:hypothetical protein
MLHRRTIAITRKQHTLQMQISKAVCVNASREARRVEPSRQVWRATIVAAVPAEIIQAATKHK